MKQQVISAYIIPGLKIKEKDLLRYDLKPGQIISKVAEYYNLPINQVLLTKHKKGEIGNARRISIFLIRNLLWIQFREIGKLFGNITHASVIYGCNIIEAELMIYPKLRKEIKEILTGLLPEELLAKQIKKLKL